MADTSGNRPAEVFGHSIADGSEQAQQDRQRHWCPFLGERCSKKSRTIDYPFGVCSVQYGGATVAICPNRFRQGERVLGDIADYHFGSQNNLIPFPEVSVRTRVRGGRSAQFTFDCVLVRHKPLSSEIEDFLVIEFQTVDTTSTGKLGDALQAFMAGEDIQDERYAFGMNWANVWKRCFIQILQKGTIVERWGHKIYWVVQEPAYGHLQDNYGLYDLTFARSDATVFAIYDLEGRAGGYDLVQSRLESSTVDGLFEAFQRNTPVPSKQRFVDRLEERVREEQSRRMKLKLETD